MAKKKKKQHPKQGHPARLANQVVSFGRAKVERGLDELTPEFVRWYGQFRQDPETAMLVLATVGETLGMYAEVVGLDSVHGFDAPLMLGVLHSMIEFEEAEQDAQDNGQMRMLLYMAWADYLDFLEDTGRWTQEMSALHWMRENLELDDDPFTGGELDDEGGIQTLDAVALQEMLELPVVALGRELVTWSSSGPEVPWKGMVEGGFLTAAATALDSEILAGLAPERIAPVLESVFFGLVEAEVLDVDKHRITQGTAAQHFHGGGAAAHEPAYVFVQAFLDLLLEAPGVPEDDELQGWGLANLWVLEAIEGQSHLVAEPADSKFSPESWALSHERMAELRLLGLVEAGEYYTVPRVVAAALTDVGDAPIDDDELDAEQWESLFDPELEDEPKREKRAEPYTGKVLQLKLGLQQAKPPIWRRVLVPMDLNLGDLHDIIQTAFEWYDGHLHQFRAGRTTYGPQAEYLHSDHDESTVLVSAVLKAAKDRLDYDYDFGDGWEIRIDVEKVLDSDSGQLPRCTGGRRMAPMENSGGTWGWAAKLEAIADPAHEEHEEVMEWLEDSGYDYVDPAAFSVEEINEALDQEF